MKGSSVTDTVDSSSNKRLILISGKSTAGKSASLRNIRNQEKWFYFNFEAGKDLPFRNKFHKINITDPMDIFDYLNEIIENQDQVEGVIFDSVTFMMEMYESVHVYGSTNTQSAWGDFQQFWKRVVQEYIPLLTCPVIMTAHVFDVVGEKGVLETMIPVKGALAKNGLEAYFSINVLATKIPIKDIEKNKNSMFTVTEDEEDYGYKHVFQTRPVKGNTNTRIRAPMDMWKRDETFIDNDVQMLLDHVNEFYNS